MKFIVDECTGATAAKWLAEEGYDVLSISPEKRGISDKEILQIATDEKRIIITNDKDFGELIFKERTPHNGVIFLRLADETAKNKILILKKLLTQHIEIIDNEHFIVVTEKSIRKVG